MLAGPLLLFWKTDFRSWKWGHCMFGGEDGRPNAVEDAHENKTALRLESWTECSNDRKYSFMCPIFGYIIMDENARGSTYSWVDRFTICMVSASYQLRDSVSLLTVVPNGLVRHPDLYPLQASNGKDSIRVRTLPYNCAEVITPRSYKYHELWKCLTSHCGDYYLTRA